MNQQSDSSCWCSGGKDSCYSSMLCEAHGHDIIALGNLFPEDDATQELDSYMYQTAGHQMVAAVATCAGLPLFRRRLSGSSKQQASMTCPASLRVSSCKHRLKTALNAVCLLQAAHCLCASPLHAHFTGPHSTKPALILIMIHALILCCCLCKSRACGYNTAVTCC